MLRTLRDDGDRRPLVLIYANPTEESILFRDELADLHRVLELKVVHVLERPPHDWTGERGRVDAALLERQGGRVVAHFAGGATADAPSLVAELNHAAAPEVRLAQLGGSGLSLVAEGDTVVLAGDGDDVDDHWTALKATRAAIVHRIVSQGAGEAELELATAAGRPLPQAGDALRDRL